jgi:predicted Holliday junction resolvase-like endonuclease
LRKDADKQLRSVRSDVTRQADVVSGRVQDAVAPIVEQVSKVTA